MARRKTAHSEDRQGKKVREKKRGVEEKKEKDTQHLNRNKRNV